MLLLYVYAKKKNKKNLLTRSSRLNLLSNTEILKSQIGEH